MRLHRFTGVLRDLGLVDRYDVGQRLAGVEDLRLSTLRSMLAPFRADLPQGITLDFLAESVLSALAEIAPDTEAWRERFGQAKPTLVGIRPGRAQAGRYHKHVFEILKAVFDRFLSNGHIEQEINAGIQRVDIMFDNTAGVFATIAARIGQASPYLPFECKNYTGDLENPEYDQVSGRLTPMIGAIGVLIFRHVRNWARANQHCQSRRKDGKVILLFDDDDLTTMYERRFVGDTQGMEEVVLGRFRSLELDVPAK